MLVAASVALVATAVGAAAVGFSGGLASINPLSSPVHPSSADQYSVPPSISSISPTEGTTGTVITITGTAFSGVTSVTINGTAAQSFTVVNDTTITAVVAAGTGTSGHVTVSKPAGADTSSDGFSYAAAAPTNTTPPAITGTQNFNGLALAFVGNTLSADPGVWSGSPTSVSFQWKHCDSSYSSCTDIGGATSSSYTLQSSDLGQTVKVFVTEHNGAGSTTASNRNNDLRGNVGAPNATADDASISGTPEQGTLLTANHGSWNGQGGVGAITFNYEWFRCGSSAPTGLSDCPTSIGSNSQTYTPVAGDSGDFLAVHIRGTNSYGSNGWSLLTFTHTAVDGPTVSSFSPTQGAAGQAVTITGAHFTGVTAVQFNGVNASSFNFNSSTSITAVVPAGATTGPVSVTTPIDTGASAGSFTVLATPGITSFSPTSGGAGTTVTITGSNFAGATAVKFNATSTSDVSVNGDGTQITTHVPVGATTGKLSVITPAGTGVSSGNFTILAVPTITKFAPLSGVAGNTITITGKSFTGVTGVAFNGVQALFNFVSDTSLTATVPASATTGPITVSTAAGTGTTGSTSFVVQRTPTITGFTPSIQQPGGTVQVTGTNFVGITSVQLGDTTLATSSVTSVTPTSLTLKVPPFTSSFTAGSYQIQITNLAGTGDSGSSLLQVANLALPPAFGIDVTSGHPTSSNFDSDSFPATTVTLTPTSVSTSFADFGVTSVLFGTKADSTFTLSGRTIVAHVPVGAATGTIKVVNAKGQAIGPNFTVEQPPVVTSFSPTSGAPGRSITISGVNLFRSGHTTKVKFGTSSAITITPPGTITASSPISVQVPSDAADGAIQVEVSSVGSGTSSGLFNRVTGPTINADGISPSVGTTGTLVTINGTGFSGGSVPTVKFGLLNGTGVTVVNDSKLTVRTPAPTNTSRPLSVDVQVSNDAGPSNTISNGFTYSAAPSGITPSPLHGPANTQMTTLVTLTGSNFAGVTSVMFGTKAATIVSADATTIKVFAPVGATTGAIKVTTPAGTGSSSVFAVDQPPTVTTFTPAPPNSGVDLNCTNCVTINGSNFIDKNPAGFPVTYTEPVDSVTVNGVAMRSFTVNATGTQIIASLPAGGMTTGPIVVGNSFTGSSTTKTSLIVRGNPTIDSFSPGSGTVGSKVTITGTNLAGGSLTVKFNGVSASSIVVQSDTSVLATVPSGASTGPISVTRGVSTATSDDDFFIAQKPSISSFDPASGPGSAQATTVVDIQGSHFLGSTSVLFNGKASPFVVVNDDGDITALVPAGATTGKLTVVNPAGNATSSGVFTVDGVPVVTSLSPTSGAENDVVTISGKNLVGEMDGTAYPDDTFVDFHGFFGAIVDSITSSQIQVEVPAGAVTGPLMVTDVWGQTAVTPLFTVINPPSIAGGASGFYNEFTGLQSGKKGEPVVIFGSGFTGTSSVRFHGTSAPFTVVADWEILASVPKGATTGPITVSNSAGTASTSPRNFTILP